MKSTKCEAKTIKDAPCRAWAVRGSDPPRCAAHGGGQRPVGAPDGNHNAKTHGLYSNPGELTSIEAIITDLANKQTHLSHLIEAGLQEQPDLEILAQFFALHGQNASRLGRLLRDQRALSGDAADGISNAVAQALDEVSTLLGVEL